MLRFMLGFVCTTLQLIGSRFPSAEAPMVPKNWDREFIYLPPEGFQFCQVFITAAFDHSRDISLIDLAKRDNLIEFLQSVRESLEKELDKNTTVFAPDLERLDQFLMHVYDFKVWKLLGLANILRLTGKQHGSTRFRGVKSLSVSYFWVKTISNPMSNKNASLLLKAKLDSVFRNKSFSSHCFCWDFTTDVEAVLRRMVMKKSLYFNVLVRDHLHAFPEALVTFDFHHIYDKVQYGRLPVPDIYNQLEFSGIESDHEKDIKMIMMAMDSLATSRYSLNAYTLVSGLHRYVAYANYLNSQTSGRRTYRLNHLEEFLSRTESFQFKCTLFPDYKMERLVSVKFRLNLQGIYTISDLVQAARELKQLAFTMIPHGADVRVQVNPLAIGTPDTCDIVPFFSDQDWDSDTDTNSTLIL